MRRLLFVLACAAAPASAQPAADPSLVAGYKAAFTCSAYFNAGRSVDQIAGDELNRIYPDYRDAMATLPDAVIDEEKRIVAVAYDGGVRFAAWRPLLGCTQLPSMAQKDAAAELPMIAALRDRATPRPLSERYSNDPDLGARIEAAFDRTTYGDGTETTAALVMQGGVIIAERYRDGFDRNTPQRTWSVAKSIAATIIGAAVEDGLIATDEPASVEAWSTPGDPRGEITVADLMHMASGLDSSPAGNRTDDVYFGGGRVVDHAITRRLVRAPGTAFVYANNDTMALMRALRERMNDDRAYLDYPFSEVLLPLGMDRTFLETDWNGDFILSSQVWTTARDLARLGQLYLDDGVVEEKRILPKGWAKFIATPSGPQPEDRREGENRPGYGAQFWLFGARHGLPEGTYAAMGNRGQFLIIVPSHDLIIVRRGFDDGGGFDIAKFSADIIAAIDAPQQ